MVLTEFMIPLEHSPTFLILERAGGVHVDVKLSS